MDILTQMVLGASVSSLANKKEEERKIMLSGAFIAAIPDSDIFLSLFTDDFSEIFIHRSFSHALLPLAILSLVLGFGLNKSGFYKRTTAKESVLLCLLILYTHVILDCFTTWGTQLFWPFDLRIATRSVYVIDLLYSAPLGLALLYHWINPRKVNSLKILRGALIYSTVYLLFLLTWQSMGERKILLDSDKEIQRIESQAGLFRPLKYRMILVKRDSILISKNTYNITMEPPDEYFKLKRGLEYEDILNESKQFQAIKGLTEGLMSIQKIDSLNYKIIDLRYGPKEEHSEEFDSGFIYYLSKVNDKWQFKQELRMMQKLRMLWEKLLREIGLG